MKKVLGLDLGSTSIGWAVVELDSDSPRIVDMGSRIIPLTPDDATQFTKGQAITKNADRTAARTARKCNDRYQLRRANLQETLVAHGMTPEKIVHPIKLWELRSKAVTEQLSLPEIGRVLMHMNQKRGYKSGKDDYNDSAKTKYVQGVNSRYQDLKEKGLTIGQYLYGELLKDGSFRVKDLVYPRLAYMEEFDKIIECQKKFYPDLFSDALVNTIRNETIFYQRRLKSCKHLVSICEFEKKEYLKGDGSVVVSGPHVAPKSSPVAQLDKIWEFVNTIKITNRFGEKLAITPEQKKAIAEYLQYNDKLKITELQKILGYNKKEWFVEKTTFQRIVGNTTYIRLAKALDGKYPNLLRMDINVTEYADSETGEMRKIVDEAIKTEPLFQLWHTLYSIPEEDRLRAVLGSKFGIDDKDILDELCKIDFVKEAYSSKSNTAIRKILPYLFEGYVFSDACALAGYNHSNYVTKEENLSRELAPCIDRLKKGELRQPIVEKILNQTINVVNALNNEYGQFDEIRVELARNLKQSREEREKTSKKISQDERENQKMAERISEYDFTPTRNRIMKMKMWEETEHLCIYCNQPVNVTEFLSGIDVEKEHIIPRSLLFDNSFANVTCSCRNCNQQKGNMTAFDFMKTKGVGEFDNYVKRVNDLYDKHKINRTKHDHLLMSQDNIPTDFINRQLRETQYISKKAMELLKGICHNVYATSGNVTDYLRHIWGWDNVLHDLHFDKYKAAGLTSMKEISRNGNVKTAEVISDWSKRMDHRHHAIDALTIACTSQSMIQQLNSLSTLRDINVQEDAQSETYKEKHSKLEKYVLSQQYFSSDEVKKAAEQILISFKSGKKVTTPGKRYSYSGGKRTLMQNTLVPRGALSEQTVYGKIVVNGKEQVVVKQAVGTIDLKKAERIVDKRIREIVINYLETNNNKISDDKPVLDPQGRRIRSVRVYTGLDAVVPVKCDGNGNATGYVKPGNNHHIAIYRDKEGKYHERVVTFWHAVERKQKGLPVVIKDPSAVYDSLIDSNLPETFLAQLPQPGWSFVMSMQQNEMFVLGMSEDSFNDAIREHNYAELSRHLYRVQKIASVYYVFRQHLETSVDDKYNGVKNENLSIKLGKFIRINSFNTLFSLNPHKVRINNLGHIEND